MLVVKISVRHQVVVFPLLRGDGLMADLLLYFLPIELFHGCAKNKAFACYANLEGVLKQWFLASGSVCGRICCMPRQLSRNVPLIKFSYGLEFLLKFLAAFFEEAHIRLAIRQQFFSIIELVIFGHTDSMPFLKVCFSGGGHSVRIKISSGGYWAYVGTTYCS